MKNQKKNIHGVVLLDKPSGITSNKVLQKIRQHFNARKAGHTGSLDPLATGLLPICFGQATKVSEYFLHADKKYQTVIKLGEVTDTLDADGVVLSTHKVAVSEAQLQEQLGKFRGAIEQVPPMYSALKQDGQPLYKLARKGEEVERPARKMMVHCLTAKRLDEAHVELTVHCSSGFYIRSLAHDLGQALGCGAHVVSLRRTEKRSISIAQAHSLEHVLDANSEEVLLPIDALLQHMPRLDVSEPQLISMIQGRVTHADGLETNGLTRFYAPDGSLFGIGEVDLNHNIKTRKMFITD